MSIISDRDSLKWLSLALHRISENPEGFDPDSIAQIAGTSAKEIDRILAVTLPPSSGPPHPGQCSIHDFI